MAVAPTDTGAGRSAFTGRRIAGASAEVFGAGAVSATRFAVLRATAVTAILVLSKVAIGPPLTGVPRAAAHALTTSAPKIFVKMAHGRARSGSPRSAGQSD
jgi:hypothetical protein